MLEIVSMETVWDEVCMECAKIGLYMSCSEENNRAMMCAAKKILREVTPRFTVGGGK